MKPTDRLDPFTHTSARVWCQGLLFMVCALMASDRNGHDDANDDWQASEYEKPDGHSKHIEE